MTSFHAVMKSETGEEFGVGIEAPDRDAAYARLRDYYPESSCVQLEDPADMAAREHETYMRVAREIDGDDDFGMDDDDFEDEDDGF